MLNNKNDKKKSVFSHYLVPYVKGVFILSLLQTVGFLLILFVFITEGIDLNMFACISVLWFWLPIISLPVVFVPLTIAALLKGGISKRIKFFAWWIISVNVGIGILLLLSLRACVS